MPPPFQRDLGRLPAGAIAPRSGVYRVHHYAHRLPHTVIVLKGDVLPRCNRCGSLVQFAPMVAGNPISEDPDFSQASESAAAS
jgi:hypothetical protein